MAGNDFLCCSNTKNFHVMMLAISGLAFIGALINLTFCNLFYGIFIELTQYLPHLQLNSHVGNNA
jgi:hypothetical protein